MSARDIHGIITVLNTPFLADDRIDFAGLSRHVEYAIESGVAGFLVPALAGEAGALTDAERITLTEAVVRESGGRVPVIGGASARHARDRLRIAADLLRVGCDGILVSIDAGETDSIEHHLRELAALDPPFLMLQDWDPAGPGLPVPLITRLFDSVPAFTWLKIEVVPAGPKYSEVLEATRGRLRVAGGWAVMQMIEALDRGVHAFMPTGMHRIYVAIYDLYTRGQRDAAQALFERVLPVLAFSNQELNTSIQFFKRLLHAQGIYATDRVRPPVPPFDPIQEQIAGRLIERVQQIEAELPK